MRLRSGYVKTEDVEDWKYCFNESDSESDGLDEPADEQTDRKPKIEPDTLDSFSQVDHQTRGAYDDEQRPWVPAQLPSCVPRSSPMPTQKPSKHRSGAQHRSGDAQQLLHPRVYQLGGPQQACAGHDRIAGPQPRGNNMTNTFPGYVTMGAGLDLPWMTPAANSCYSFGFQVPVPMAPAYPNVSAPSICFPSSAPSVVCNATSLSFSRCTRSLVLLYCRLVFPIVLCLHSHHGHTPPCHTLLLLPCYCLPHALYLQVCPAALPVYL